jgi:predicted AlkP superfamily phosphohydrolase/phosphomutase
MSSVSWTSFATGVNPGEHGIFGFTDLQPQDYSSISQMPRCQGLSLREILGRRIEQLPLAKIFGESRSPASIHHLQSPHTYPASPMNGTLVSGFVAINQEGRLSRIGMHTSSQ